MVKDRLVKFIDRLIRAYNNYRRGILQRYNRAYTNSHTDHIRFFDLELPQHPRFQDPVRLLCYGAQVNSKNYEDGMIQEIFRRIGTKNKVFVEIGVGDGTENNTAFLLSTGWTGFWFECGDRHERALKGRTDLADNLVVHKAFVSRENIGPLFHDLNVPHEFDFFSLDIDQNTFHVWAGLERTPFRPRVVVVEYNAAIPPPIHWAVRYDPKRMWDSTQNFGASLSAFEDLGRSMGYNLVGCDFTGSNAFFVRNDCASNKFKAPFTAENHHEPPRYHLYHTRIYKRAILDRS